MRRRAAATAGSASPRRPMPQTREIRGQACAAPGDPLGKSRGQACGHRRPARAGPPRLRAGPPVALGEHRLDPAGDRRGGRRRGRVRARQPVRLSGRERRPRPRSDAGPEPWRRHLPDEPAGVARRRARSDRHDRDRRRARSRSRSTARCRRSRRATSSPWPSAASTTASSSTALVAGLRDPGRRSDGHRRRRPRLHDHRTSP